MSDIEFRVDKAFSTAVEEQLAEQRAIRGLVARVEESLVALSDGLVDVSDHIDAVGDRVGGVSVSPEDLSGVHQQLTGHIEGVSRQLSAVEDRLTQRTDDDTLASTMSETRADLLDALARLERSSLPIAEAVEASRQDVITTLQRISEVMETDRDRQWEQAVEHLDGAITRLGVGQQDQLGIAESALAAQQGHAESALAAQQGNAESALATQQENAESALATQQENAESTLAAQQEKAEAALKVMEARARATFEEMVDSLASGREDILAQVGRLASEVDVRNDAIADSLGAVLAASTNVAPQVQDVLSGIAGRLTDLLRDQKEEATEVVRLLTEVRTTSQQGEARLDELAETLTGRLEGLAADRLAEIQEVANESARRTDSAVQQAVSDLLVAQAETAGQDRDSREGLAEAADAIQPMLEQALQDLSSALLTSSDRGAERMGTLGITVAARLEEMTEGRLREMHEAATRTAAEVRAASESLVGTAETIQPVLRTALDELTAALVARTDGDREEVDAAVARLADAAVEARETVLGAVGQATARLSEAQADGIERLTAVTDDLGRLPDTIHPPVMEAMRQMQAAVGEAITDLRTTTADAARQARTTLEDAARMSESATEALGQVATGLEPAVRTALAEVQTTLLATSAADRDRAERNISVIADASQAAADEIRGVTHAATENLSRSAETATTRLVLAQADGVEALSEAATRLNAVSEEIPEVMGEARTGLVEALAGARTDIDSLLSRADEVTDRRVGAMFSRASTLMAEQLADHEQLMVARTKDLVDATDRVTPTVDALVARLQGEVASIATTVMADLETPISEASRVAEAMAPALQQVLTDFREELSTEIVANQSRVAEIGHKMTSAAVSLEQTGAQFVPTAESLVSSLISAVDGVAERTAGAASLGVGESREVLLRAIEEVRADLTGQVEAAMSAARRSALLIESAQAEGVQSMQAATSATVEALETTSVRGAEELRAAAAAMSEVTGRLEPGVAAIVEDLRGSLLAEAVAERTRADASIILLRDDVASTVEGLRAEVAATRDTTAASATELAERADLARSAMDEGVDAIRAEMATSMAGQQGILISVQSAADALTVATREVAKATEEAAAATGDLENGTEATRGQIAGLVEDLRDQVGQALEQAVDTIRQQVTTLGEQITGLRGSESAVVSAVGSEVDRLVDGVSEQVGNLAQVLQHATTSDTDPAEIGAQFDHLGTMVATVATAVAEMRSEIAAVDERTRERPPPPTLFDESEESVSTLLDGLEERVVQAVRAIPAPPAVAEGVDTAAVQRTVDAAVQQAAHVGQTRLDAVLARLDIAVDRMAVDGDRKTTSARRTEQIVSDLQRSVAEGQAQTRSTIGTLAEQLAQVLAAQEDLRGQLHAVSAPDDRPVEASGPPQPDAAAKQPEPAVGSPGAPVSTTCPDCGFVARTTPGLIAHSRTCSGRL